jgi:hypothetical protein
MIGARNSWGDVSRIATSIDHSEGALPPRRKHRTTYRCTYARMWVLVKYTWTLTITSPEKSTLTSILNAC